MVLFTCTNLDISWFLIFYIYMNSWSFWSWELNAQYTILQYYEIIQVQKGLNFLAKEYLQKVFKISIFKIVHIHGFCIWLHIKLICNMVEGCSGEQCCPWAACLITINMYFVIACKLWHLWLYTSRTVYNSMTVSILLFVQYVLDTPGHRNPSCLLKITDNLKDHNLI